MFKILSILPNTTMFAVENKNEIIELLETFKPDCANIYLDGNAVQLHIPAKKSIQIIAEDTEKFKWKGGDEHDS